MAIRRLFIILLLMGVVSQMAACAPDAEPAVSESETSVEPAATPEEEVVTLTSKEQKVYDGLRSYQAALNNPESLQIHGAKDSGNDVVGILVDVGGENQMGGMVRRIIGIELSGTQPTVHTEGEDILNNTYDILQTPFDLTNIMKAIEADLPYETVTVTG